MKEGTSRGKRCNDHLKVKRKNKISAETKYDKTGSRKVRQS